MQSAANLRLLLEGSQRVVPGGKKGATPSTETVSDAYMHIPQVHGPVQEVVAGTLKMLEIELNGYQVSSNITLNTTQIVVAMEMLTAVFKSANVACMQRITALKNTTGSNVPSLPGLISASSSTAADKLYDIIIDLSDSLKEEAELAGAQLDVINATKTAKPH